MLPAWLGAGEALKVILHDGGLKMLQEMLEEWPFFSRAFIDARNGLREV